MSTDDPKKGQADERGKRTKAEVAGEDSCRCEETSRMTPRQLLGLMLSDLAFWKKRGRNKQRKS